MSVAKLYCTLCVGITPVVGTALLNNQERLFTTTLDRCQAMLIQLHAVDMNGGLDAYCFVQLSSVILISFYLRVEDW